MELGSPHQRGQLLSNFLHRQHQLAATQRALHFGAPRASASLTPAPARSQALVPDIKDIQGPPCLALPQPLELNLHPALLPQSLLPPGALPAPFFPQQPLLLSPSPPLLPPPQQEVQPQPQAQGVEAVVELPQQLRPPPLRQPLAPRPSKAMQPMQGEAGLDGGLGAVSTLNIGGIGAE